jgi:hypothetical protein
LSRVRKTLSCAYFSSYVPRDRFRLKLHVYLQVKTLKKLQKHPHLFRRRTTCNACARAGETCTGADHRGQERDAGDGEISHPAWFRGIYRTGVR